MRENSLTPTKGIPLLIVLLLLLVGSVVSLIYAATHEEPVQGIASLLVVLVTAFCFIGFFMVQPNEAKALQLFGEYRGSVKAPGLWWANPFLTKKRVSLRVRNFETEKLKVNDSTGNPIEIASVVVWKVVDSAEALFNVDDYENFVHVQSEAALRNLATGYPYDAHGEDEVALASHTAHVSKELREHVQDRLEKAGVEVIEARMSHLAYAPEIAAAMLQRQQASAVVAARTQIVEGAVGMVEMALEQLDRDNIVELDDERKAAMISNLLVVLCSDRAAHPVVNAGTLHQ